MQKIVHKHFVLQELIKETSIISITIKKLNATQT